MSSLSSAVLLLVCGLASFSSVSADLRMASQPKGNYRVQQRNAVRFVSTTALYMEPSDFNYQGLKNQRNNAYDNFLRSNIDNEQDKRNFNNEVGRDMLPFRSFEAAKITTNDPTVQREIPANAPGPAITATPGTPYLIPLRWNNPHASELEVNVWISNNQYVVPIRKPTCSGEGYQDNVFAFTIPTDFNNLGATVPGFAGCKAPGDCVLQVYAHSVESRTYSMGTPLIVTGNVPAATATNANGIAPATREVGTNLNALARETCLPSNDPSADITTAVPRVARLVSDVFNHAYQNSDYSPYSGQQPEAISRNMQASAIIKMVTGNRGELGRALLKKENPAAAALAAQLLNRSSNLIKRYESITNKIIAAIGNQVKTNDAQVAAGTTQATANCFRCAEVGATSTNRLTTNTYVPSFAIGAGQINQARALVPARYSGLITAAGTLQIYQATLNDMSGAFARAATMGLAYQPAALKTTATTMADARQFRKRNAAGQTDGGVNAAQLVQAYKAQNLVNAIQGANNAAITRQLTDLTDTVDATTEPVYPTIGDIPFVEEQADMDGRGYDSTCDDDEKLEANPNMVCETNPAMLFPVSGADDDITSAATNLQISTATVMIAAVCAALKHLF